MSRRFEIFSKPLSLMRVVTDVEGVDSIPPVIATPGWYNSEGYPTVRIYITIAFTGGTAPKVNIGVYVGLYDTEAVPVFQVARVPGYSAVTNLGEGVYAIDIDAYGDNLFLAVESVTGTPTTWSVTFRASGR